MLFVGALVFDGECGIIHIASPNKCFRNIVPTALRVASMAEMATAASLSNAPDPLHIGVYTRSNLAQGARVALL